MSDDLLNPTFEDEEDEDFLSYGEEDLPEEGLNQGGESEGAEEDQLTEEETPEEILFAISGEDGKEQQLPLNKLTPKQVKEWYDAHVNKHEWNKSNTEKAKQIAEERRAYEAQKQQFEQQLKELDQWTGYFRSNPGLQQLVAAFVQGRIPQQTLQQILGQQSGQQQPVGQQAAFGNHPALNQVVQRLHAVEQQLQKEREVRLQDRQLSEREKAMQAVLPSIPEDKREAFKQYIEQTTSNMTDMQAMYQVLANAFQWGNKDDLIKQAQQQALENQKKKQNAGVETGEQQSAVDLPKNVDLSGTRDIRRIYEKALDEGYFEE